MPPLPKPVITTFYYLTGGGPYTSVFAKFDLNALPDKTVIFLVADTGPVTASSGS